MNIMRIAAETRARTNMAVIGGEFQMSLLPGLTDHLRREIAPVALIVPLPCLDGGMRAAVEAYKAGMAALEGNIRT